MENQTVKVKRKKKQQQKNNKNVSKCLPGLRSANFIRELTKISIVRRRGNNSCMLSALTSQQVAGSVTFSSSIQTLISRFHLHVVFARNSLHFDKIPPIPSERKTLLHYLPIKPGNVGYMQGFRVWIMLLYFH